jgi:pimeloyl-ACP methyl ester carboxylesterase
LLADPPAIPGLIVGGTRDLVAPDLFRRTAAMLPQPSRALIVDGAGHWPHRENAPLVLGELLSFLAQLDGGAQPDGRAEHPKVEG